MKPSRTLYISFALITITLSVNAQDLVSIFTPKIDSLEKIINSRNTENEEMVRLLNEYARYCFYAEEFKKGLIATQNARDLSTKIEFEGGKIMYYLTLSTFLGTGNMSNYYERQAEWLSRNSSNQLSGYYSDLIFPIGYPKPDLRSLLDPLLLAYEHFTDIDDKEIQASIISPISICYFWFLNDMPGALKYVNTALSLYDELELTYPYLLYSSYKIGILTNQGKEEEAKRIELELVDLIAKSEDENMIGLITSSMATGYSNSGRHALAIEYHWQSIEAFERIGDYELLADTYRLMGIDYENLEMNSKASEAYLKYVNVSEILNDSSMMFRAYDHMVSPLIALKRYDDAKKYMLLSLGDTLSNNKSHILGRYNDAEGQMLKDQGYYAEAIPYFMRSYNLFKQNDNSRWSAPFSPLLIADCYLEIGDYMQALEYAQQCLAMEYNLNSNRTVIKNRVSLLLSRIYEKLENREKAYEFLKMHQSIRAESDRLDEVNRIKDAEVRSILDKSQREINQLEEARIREEQQNRVQRLWIFSISGALISAIIFALILYRNNQNKRKANALLKEQKEEIQVTLKKLESTQSQLIHSEKMASLGELTAGIAHEIQNPLNFVNNFSEVSKELIDELKDERSKANGVRNEKIEQEILIDIDRNLEKINHHGQRASDIVKSMLHHSRTDEGVKEPTDINILADEYLRLAYHGLRAKDKSFNAEFKTELDESLPRINMNPQDIGRVLLNLINNAFYAVDKKVKSGINDFKPEVFVSTRKTNDIIEINVKDNGEGIPKHVKEKIFQPFFTTKPAGSGTGLGLSLSYDIVKAHGGDMIIKTDIGKSTEFTIQLPVS